MGALKRLGPGWIQQLVHQFRPVGSYTPRLGSQIGHQVLSGGLRSLPRHDLDGLDGCRAEGRIERNCVVEGIDDLGGGCSQQGADMLAGLAELVPGLRVVGVLMGHALDRRQQPAGPGPPTGIGPDGPRPRLQKGREQGITHQQQTVSPGKSVVEPPGTKRGRDRESIARAPAAKRDVSRESPTSNRLSRLENPWWSPPARSEYAIERESNPPRSHPTARLARRSARANELSAAMARWKQARAEPHSV